MKRQRRYNPIKNTIINYLNSNLKIYFILIIIFLIGIILGIFFVNNTSKDNQTQISNYINNFLSSIKSGEKISTNELIKQSILNDCFTISILWILGSTVIGMPLIYLAIIYKGYSIGYSLASIIATLGIKSGLIFILLVLVLPYLIYIPAILTSGVSGIKLYKLVIDDHRKENIKIQIIRHTLLSLLTLIILIISSIIETYLSIWSVTFLDKI